VSAETKAALMAALQAEVKSLREAIQAYLDGDYENPRKHRPGPCKHGTYYYMDCADGDYFQAVLDSALVVGNADGLGVGTGPARTDL
jgi:hypothetical protein